MPRYSAGPSDTEQEGASRAPPVFAGHRRLPCRSCRALCSCVLLVRGGKAGVPPGQGGHCRYPRAGTPCGAGGSAGEGEPIQSGAGYSAETGAGQSAEAGAGDCPTGPGKDGRAAGPGAGSNGRSRCAGAGKATSANSGSCRHLIFTPGGSPGPVGTFGRSGRGGVWRTAQGSPRIRPSRGFSPDRVRSAADGGNTQPRRRGVLRSLQGAYRKEQRLSGHGQERKDGRDRDSQLRAGA